MAVIDEERDHPHIQMKIDDIKYPSIKGRIIRLKNYHLKRQSFNGRKFSPRKEN
jgi:hypothetical protein